MSHTTPDTGGRMNTKETLKVIYFRESLLQSVLADILSYGFLLITFWLNYKFIGGNNFVDCMLLFIFVIFTTSKVNGRKLEFTSYKEMIEHLKKESSP